LSPSQPVVRSSLCGHAYEQISGSIKTGDIFRTISLAMKNHLVPLLLCASALNFAVACSNSYSAHPLSADQPASSKPMRYEPKKTQIISEPPGARIEINDNYVGDAPITVELAQRGDYFDEDTVIRAIPTEGGDYPQTKRFLTSDPWYHPGSAGDKIPSRIFFNMHLVPGSSISLNR
jgi:PEGA domain